MVLLMVARGFGRVSASGSGERKGSSSVWGKEDGGKREC